MFGVVGGESNKYKSGIGMGIEGLKVVVGAAKSMEEGKVVVEGYVEHGKGNYKVEEINGTGMTSYIGIGRLGRCSIGEKRYVDMSISVGREGVDFDSKWLNVLTKENIGYESNGMYVGGHVGCRYKYEASDKLNLDIAGKLLMMNQEGKKEKLTNGAPIEFEGAASGKIKGIYRSWI